MSETPIADETKALATVTAPSHAALRANMGHAQPMAIVPRTFLEAQSFAGALAVSELVPRALKDRAPDVLMIVLAGAELGIPPVQALRLHHVIEGVPRLSSDGIASVVMASPLCEYLECVETTDTRCTWRTKRRGRPEQSRTWTKERAVRAGLWDRKNRDGGPGMWMKYPERMLSARAKSELCRDVYPEIAAGLLSAEEANDGAIDVEFIETRSSSAAFTAPPPMIASAPPAPARVAETAPARRGPGRPPKEKPIDTVAEERPTPPTASAAPTVPPTPAPAASDAPASAPSSASASQPSPSTASASPASSSDGQNSVPTPIPPPAEAPAEPTADDDSGFGGEDPVDTTPARTIQKFRAEVAAVRPGADAAAKLDAIKRDWVPWSTLDGPEGGKQHAREMREVFAKAKAELGL